MYIISAILEGGDINAAIEKHQQLQRTRHEIYSRIANSRSSTLPADARDGGASGDASVPSNGQLRPMWTEQ